MKRRLYHFDASGTSTALYCNPTTMPSTSAEVERQRPLRVGHHHHHDTTDRRDNGSTGTPREAEAPTRRLNFEDRHLNHCYRYYHRHRRSASVSAAFLLPFLIMMMLASGCVGVLPDSDAVSDRPPPATRTTTLGSVTAPLINGEELAPFAVGLTKVQRLNALNNIRRSLEHYGRITAQHFLFGASLHQLSTPLSSLSSSEGVIAASEADVFITGDDSGSSPGSSTTLAPPSEAVTRSFVSGGGANIYANFLRVRADLRETSQSSNNNEQDSSTITAIIVEQQQQQQQQSTLPFTVTTASTTAELGPTVRALGADGNDGSDDDLLTTVDGRRRRRLLRSAATASHQMLGDTSQQQQQQQQQYHHHHHHYQQRHGAYTSHHHQSSTPLHHHRRRRKGCPPLHGKDQLLCPSRNAHHYDVCVTREQLCDHVEDCPGGEDEDHNQCFFYKPLDDQLKTLSHAVLLLVESVMSEHHHHQHGGVEPLPDANHYHHHHYKIGESSSSAQQPENEL